MEERSEVSKSAVCSKKRSIIVPTGKKRNRNEGPSFWSKICGGYAGKGGKKESSQRGQEKRITTSNDQGIETIRWDIGEKELDNAGGKGIGF